MAEALLGPDPWEDLGVPKWLLGKVEPELANTQCEVPEAFTGSECGLLVMFVLVPISILMMLVIFQRSAVCSGAPSSPWLRSGLACSFYFWAHGLAGCSDYLTIAVMPSVATAMAVTDEIHVTAATLPCCA